MKIYVASSWRNQLQPAVVEALRRLGHNVYDFRHPAPGNDGFSWKSCAFAGVDWKDWTRPEFLEALERPAAREGFDLDMNALRACDACVLALPCGKSAHLELGWAVGNGKRTAIYMGGGDWEAELMYRMVDKVCLTIDILEKWVEEVAESLAIARGTVVA